MGKNIYKSRYVKLLTYENNCFSPNWIEIDLNEIKKQEKKSSLNRTQTNKESYLENHKDLDTLLKELNEI